MNAVPVHILVVDDDDEVRASLIDELSSEYAVDQAASGVEAFDALSARAYDVVISDLRMPDHDGIEVLDFARRRDPDVIRVLLTGYLDEDAHQALLTPDAPYKVGKPWHDEIEVVVRRALEQREHARRLGASVEDALSLATLDDELARAADAQEIAEVLVRRALTIEGVIACGVVTATGKVVAGTSPAAAGEGWYDDHPIDADGQLRVRARGKGDSARALIAFLAHRAQRRAGVTLARGARWQPMVADGRSRVHALLRQATAGALTSMLLHDLASILQAIEGSLDKISAIGEDHAVPGLTEAVGEAAAAGAEAVSLFVAMRRFIRAGSIASRTHTADQLVQGALLVAGAYVRQRATLRTHVPPDLEVDVCEPLFLQVLVNLLRNAANVSPPGGFVDLEVKIVDSQVVFTVVDDGPGVDPSVADQMFEPFCTTDVAGAGLGLAISAYVMQVHGGVISYRRHPTRGALFTAVMPATAAAVKPEPAVMPEPMARAG